MIKNFKLNFFWKFEVQLLKRVREKNTFLDGVKSHNKVSLIKKLNKHIDFNFSQSLL